MLGLSKNIKIGRMDLRITFRQSTDTQSDSGATVESFADVATVWANVTANGSGSERFVMEKETAFNRKFFTIRYRTDLNEKMILIYESEEYDIKSLQELENTRKRFLKIQAEKRT